MRNGSLGQLRVEHAHRALVGRPGQRLGALGNQRLHACLPVFGTFVAHLSDPEHVAADLDAELTQQLPGDRAAGHPHGRFPRAGPVDHRPQVVEPVLLCTHQVCMAGAGERDFLDAFAGALDGHHLGPVRPIAMIGGIVDTQGNGTADRLRKAYARVDVHPVLLDLSTATPTVALPASGQLFVDHLGRERHPGRHAFNNADQSLSVRLTGGQIAQHRRKLASGYYSDRAGTGTS